MMVFNTLNSNKLTIFSLSGFLLIAIVIAAYLFWPRPFWSEAEIAVLRGLWLGSLEPLPSDPSNQYADDPRAAALGQKLFFDTRFSSNGKVACATCHKPELGFQDGKPLAQGVGHGLYWPRLQRPQARLLELGEDHRALGSGFDRLRPCSRCTRGYPSSW